MRKMNHIRVTVRGRNIPMLRSKEQLVPANDSANLLRAPLSDLRLQESAILAEIACGDIDERKAWQELTLVRRSILASRGHGVLHVA